MALKGILKNKRAAAPEAGPSKPRHAGAGGRSGGPGGHKGGNAGKAKAKATMSVPAPKDKGKARKPAPESDDEDADEDADMSSEGELDTEDEIERAQAGSEKKPLKRKRVTTAADFGSTLTTLLSEPATKKSRAAKLKADKLADAAGEAAEPPSKHTDGSITKKGKPAAAPILALSAKPLPPSQAAERLERRAARALKAEKEERLDRARVRNVLEGWTPAEGADVGSQEFERALRKTAQRGVIKLFNAILVASRNAEAAAKTLADKAGVKPEAPKSRKEKDNILGRGAREDALTKESFLDLVRKGGSR